MRFCHFHSNGVSRIIFHDVALHTGMCILGSRIPMHIAIDQRTIGCRGRVGTILGGGRDRVRWDDRWRRGRTTANRLRCVGRLIHNGRCERHVMIGRRRAGERRSGGLIGRHCMMNCSLDVLLVSGTLAGTASSRFGIGIRNGFGSGIRNGWGWSRRR